MFDANTDKSRMHEVPHDEMLEYAGGDTDATFRLAKTLLPLAKQDSRNWRTFTHIQMPALRAFIRMEENGVLIDKDELRNLEQELGEREEEAYEELIAEVDPKVLRRHEGKWSFGRPDFIRDILFSSQIEGGLGITPLVFTKTTAVLSPEEQVPSTSVKDHLAFFDDNEFVQKLISYQKLSKMRSTYVGKEAKAEVSKVERLKGGDLPKKVRDLFSEEGVEVPKSKAVRRRKRVLDAPRIVEASPSQKYRVDEFGNVEQKLLSDPTGFWQYLKDADRIHPSFLLHGTVTGRTSCLPESERVWTDKGWVTMGELVRRFSDGEKFDVLTHKGRMRAVKKAWSTGERTLLRIRTEGGSVLRCTDNHPLLVKTENGDVGWMPAGEVSKMLLSGREILTAKVDNPTLT